MNCENKIAIVTGAAGNGMGRSIALTLAREGASVVVNYRTSEETAKVIVETIRAQGGKAIPVAADIFTPEGCRHLVDTACEAFGQVDICIIGPGGGVALGGAVDRASGRRLEGAVDYLTRLGMASVRAHEVALTAHLMNGLQPMPKSSSTVRQRRSSAGVWSPSTWKKTMKCATRTSSPNCKRRRYRRARR